MLGNVTVNSNEQIRETSNETLSKTESEQISKRASEQKLKNSNTRRVQFYVDEETYKIVKALSLKTGYSISDFIRHCIQKYLQQADPQKIEQLKQFFEN